MVTDVPTDAISRPSVGEIQRNPIGPVKPAELMADAPVSDQFGKFAEDDPVALSMRNDFWLAPYPGTVR